MAGRFKKEDSRDNQYRVRLNDSENEMLDYVSKMNEKTKSEVFRQALTELYEKTKLAEARKGVGLLTEDDQVDGYDYEHLWEDDHVSLQRAISCPYCGHTHMMNFSDHCQMSSSERSMGPEILYEFDLEECVCDKCRKQFRVKGYISEYPMGAYNHEGIDVKKYDDEDEED